ncbi:MAG: PaaI family thioesterase [Litorimonas sp.]
MSKFIERLWELGPQMVGMTPHARELGIKFVAVDKNRATMSLPYNPALIGNKNTGVIHGGAVTTLLDQASGLAAMAGFDGIAPIATLSLRIDYMRAAKVGETIIGQAHCYKTTKHVAFIRALAHDGDEDTPIATAQACFMITGPFMNITEDGAT